MRNQKVPNIASELRDRIDLVRRDIGNLLFHFTRIPRKEIIIHRGNFNQNLGREASSVLNKILIEEKLIGTSEWIKGCTDKCISFTEAPISELAALFSLVRIAATKKLRPRYEPYGIAVSKKWLYERGGRPVVYDHQQAYKQLPKRLRYRFVPYNPLQKIDTTWEREWRICIDELVLDPLKTLVIVPDAITAYNITYGYAQEKTSLVYKKDAIKLGKRKSDQKAQSWVVGNYREPKWMAVSLDLFGIDKENL